MLKIKEKHFSSFFKVPFNLYEKDEPYVSAFKSDLKKNLSVKNPVFETEEDFTFYTAFKDGQPAGRISVHHHKEFNQRFDTNTAYFGFFECINQQQVANELLALAENWARERGFGKLSGNFNVTAMQEMGVQVSGFENTPYTAQMFGKPYYPQLLKNAGFSPTFPMSTFEVALSRLDEKELLKPRQQELINDQDYEFIPITKKIFKNHTDELVHVFNEGFKHNHLFVPFTEEQFKFQADGMLMFLDEHISVLVRHMGKAVAISLHCPDINPFLKDTHSRFTLLTPWHIYKHRKIHNRVICIFSSVIPEYQNTGITGAVSYYAIKWMKQRGYHTFGITWVSPDNEKSLRKVENMKGRKLHELRIFEKQLD